MRVSFTRPHVGGSMSGIGNDVKVVDVANNEDDSTPAVPEGGTMVDPNTPVQDWTWSNAPAARGINGGNK